VVETSTWGGVVETSTWGGVVETSTWGGVVEPSTWGGVVDVDRESAARFERAFSIHVTAPRSIETARY
jgi:hypothetical protein